MLALSANECSVYSGFQVPFRDKTDLGQFLWSIFLLQWLLFVPLFKTVNGKEVHCGGQVQVFVSGSSSFIINGFFLYNVTDVLMTVRIVVRNFLLRLSVSGTSTQSASAGYISRFILWVLNTMLIRISR